MRASSHPRIVVLDGYALNPGDLSWLGMAALGELTVFTRCTPSEITPRAGPAEILLTNKTPITAATIAACDRLRYIGVLATGYNCVDVAVARARGIVVTNVPDYGTASVAQHTLSLMLDICRRVGRHAEAVKRGGWSAQPDWCFWETPQIELSDMKLGIVGHGRIGCAVATLAEAFGMRVAFATRAGGEAALAELLKESDFVSLHCPLNSATKHLINQSTLKLMKPSGYLINTSRGGLIDEQALLKALNESQIAGAALDVLQEEPPPADHPLLAAKNCLITPHIGWATSRARSKLMEIAVQNVRAFLATQPQNVVS